MASQFFATVPVHCRYTDKSIPACLSMVHIRVRNLNLLLVLTYQVPCNMSNTVSLARILFIQVITRISKQMLLSHETVEVYITFIHVRTKQLTYQRHSIHHHQPVHSRLHSRNSFISTYSLSCVSPQNPESRSGKNSGSNR